MSSNPGELNFFLANFLCMGWKAVLIYEQTNPDERKSTWGEEGDPTLLAKNIMAHTAEGR